MKKEYAKMDAGLLHRTNKKVILKLIQEKNHISRSELGKITGLTPPTITRLTNELISEGLVENEGIGNSSGGRPPVVVRFKYEGNYIIGIDLGATYIRGGLVDFKANFISEIQVPTEIEKGYDSIIEKVVHLVDKLLKRKDSKARIWGIGIGVAGLVNHETGIIESSPDFGWKKVNLKEELGKHFDLPFFYDNSTRLMALGELKLGNQHNLKNFAVINIGYGIASGLVVEGNLVKGHEGFAGEFGHIAVDTNSDVQCKCGNYGCLEALASGNRIATLGKEEIQNGNADILKNLCNGNMNLVSSELVAKSAKMGDVASLEIYEHISEYLCKGIGILANLINPQIIYIGGGVSLSGQFFFDLIESKKSKYLLPANANIQIIPSSFGEQATIIGAVSLVLDKIINLELTADQIKHKKELQPLK